MTAGPAVREYSLSIRTLRANSARGGCIPQRPILRHRMSSVSTDHLATVDGRKTLFLKICGRHARCHRKLSKTRNPILWSDLLFSCAPFLSMRRSCATEVLMDSCGHSHHFLAQHVRAVRGPLRTVLHGVCVRCTGAFLLCSRWPDFSTAVFEWKG